MTTTTTTPSSSSSSSSCSFEDEIHATENFLSEKQLEEVDAFLNRYVRLNDAGKLLLFSSSSSPKTTVEEEDAFFVSGTYFWSRHSQPQTAIERYCETLCSYFMGKKKSAFFSSLFRDDDDFVGCEYWVQDVAHDEAPKAYHTDCVLEREEEEEEGGELLLRKKHPLLSTVYYGKTERGGATVAFDEEEYEKMRKCVLVKPRRNRLFAFRGDMWHGVCRDDGEGNEEAYQRVTLLVNFWKERPKCAGVFPREMFSSIRDSRSNDAINDDDDETRREEIDLSTKNDDERVFKMKSGERKAHFAAWEAQNPNAFLEPSASSSSIVLIEYTE